MARKESVYEKCRDVHVCHAEDRDYGHPRRRGRARLQVLTSNDRAASIDTRCLGEQTDPCRSRRLPALKVDAREGNLHTGLLRVADGKKQPVRVIDMKGQHVLVEMKEPLSVGSAVEIHATRDDQDFMDRSGIVVLACPRSNGKERLTVVGIRFLNRDVQHLQCTRTLPVAV